MRTYIQIHSKRGYRKIVTDESFNYKRNIKEIRSKNKRNIKEIHDSFYI